MAIINVSFSEKATKFDKISLLVLTLLSNLKNRIEISSHFVAFSDYMNFSLSPSGQKTGKFHLCAMLQKRGVKTDSAALRQKFRPRN